jgi:hypothetical protein
MERIVRKEGRMGKKEKYFQVSDVNSMKAGDFTSWTNFSLADLACVQPLLSTKRARERL